MIFPGPTHLVTRGMGPYHVNYLRRIAKLAYVYINRAITSVVER